jgi:hypothetical protein
MELKRYMERQVEAAKQHKWCLGVKTQRDPGEAAIREWIRTHGEQYRKEYEATYLRITEEVFHEVKQLTPLDEDHLRMITEYVIDAFLEKWIVDMSMEKAHVDEL